jgi:hypothetical protein
MDRFVKPIGMCRPGKAGFAHAAGPAAKFANRRNSARKQGRSSRLSLSGH